MNPWVAETPKEPGHFELLLETGLLFVVELHQDRHGSLVVWGGPYDGKTADEWGIPGLSHALWRRTEVRNTWKPDEHA